MGDRFKPGPVQITFDELDQELGQSELDREHIKILLAELKKVVGSCPECDKNFIKNRKFQIFCSVPCGSRARQKRFFRAKRYAATEKPSKRLSKDKKTALSYA